MSTKKIEGYADGITVRRESMEIASITLFTDKRFEDLSPATLVIHSGEPEPVYTKSEVRQFALDMISAALDGPYLPNTEAMEACAVKFLTTP